MCYGSYFSYLKGVFWLKGAPCRLGYHAFLTVFNNKPTSFAVLIDKIKKRMKYHNPENHRFFMGIVSEGIVNLEDVWRT